MTILIISDLHGNLEALEALPRNFDHLWVLGDLVNYGPNPAEVIQFVREHASAVVRGNHDHAIAFNEDPRCSERFRQMADETSRFTRSVLGEQDLNYLRNLPLKIGFEESGIRVLMCHATPGHPLFEYRTPESPLWFRDQAEPSSSVLLVGHTHLPFQLTSAGRSVVNPGSVGQAKHGRPEACYAKWEDSRITLHTVPYDFESTVRKLGSMPQSPAVYRDLSQVLRTGSAPVA